MGGRRRSLEATRLDDAQMASSSLSNKRPRACAPIPVNTAAATPSVQPKRHAAPCHATFANHAPVRACSTPIGMFGRLKPHDWSAILRRLSDRDAVSFALASKSVHACVDVAARALVEEKYGWSSRSARGMRSWDEDAWPQTLEVATPESWLATLSTLARQSSELEDIVSTTRWATRCGLHRVLRALAPEIVSRGDGAAVLRDSARWGHLRAVQTAYSHLSAPSDGALAHDADAAEAVYPHPIFYAAAGGYEDVTSELLARDGACARLLVAWDDGSGNASPIDVAVAHHLAEAAAPTDHAACDTCPAICVVRSLSAHHARASAASLLHALSHQCTALVDALVPVCACSEYSDALADALVEAVASARGEHVATLLDRLRSCGGAAQLTPRRIARALCIASERGDSSLVSELLSAGASSALADESGHTALGIARDHATFQLLLRERMATAPMGAEEDGTPLEGAANSCCPAEPAVPPPAAFPLQPRAAHAASQDDDSAGALQEALLGPLSGQREESAIVEVLAADPALAQHRGGMRSMDDD